jgi:hypothetical protein
MTWPQTEGVTLGALRPIRLLTPKPGRVWADSAGRKYLGRTSILRSGCDESKAGEPKSAGRSETIND